MDTKRIKRNEWTRYLYSLKANPEKKVKSVTFDLQANNFTGEINVTDLQLQVGKQVSAQVPHTSEFLNVKSYGIDERTNLLTVDGAKKKGVQPKIYTGLRNRVFNIVGRGHEVVVLANTYHEDYKEELWTSGLDLELYAKNDFDLLRISTNDGALVEGRHYDENGPLKNHSLNYKYTREFYFTGGKAGDKIVLSASQNKASVAGVDIPTGQRTVKIGKGTMSLGRQRLMVAPFGSFRLRIEFYKQVTEKITDEYGESSIQTYLKDVGIGYYGTAQFVQVKQAHLF